MSDSLTIDGFGPVPVRKISDVADVQDAVRSAAAEGTAVFPVGGRTMLDLGLPPSKRGVALDMTGLNRVIDYPARDMTVTVEAGITIAALRDLLKQEGQWLPVDVPNPQKATVGGVIAANVSGPRRLGYGTVRDYLIGISFVADNGDDVKAGGRVVKNVAGYDLMKTQTGGLGTLGVITRATFKVVPAPAAAAGLLLPVKPQDLAAVLDKLHTSQSRPCAVEVYNTTAATAGDLPTADAAFSILAAFEGSEPAVAWQLRTALEEFPVAAAQDDVATRLTALTELQIRPASAVIGKAATRPSRLAALLSGLSPQSLVHAHGLSGVAWVDTDAELPTGFLARRLHPAKKTTANVFGIPGSDRPVMAEVKAALDPKCLFNPGRGPVG